ncbi:hypothetical protein [Parabacteroides sp.]
MNINCDIEHAGYHSDDRHKSDRADLRVSDDFAQDVFDSNIKITCSKKDIEFRIRENHKGTTDINAYEGKYFSDGDIIGKTTYDKLYISDPRYKGEKESTLPAKNYKFDVTLKNASGISCSIPHDGYNSGDRDKPDRADLRVSNDFSMDVFGDHIKITCSKKNIEFRIRENHKGTTDINAYEGKYFSDGDTISKSTYDKLYISDPRYKGETESTVPKKNYYFNVTLETTKDNNIRFLVSSDFHLRGDDSTEKHKSDESDLKQLLSTLSKVGNIDFYAVCGDLTYDTNPEDEDMFEKEFFNNVRDNLKNISCVCEGWGNHDVRYKGCSWADVKKGIGYRNQHDRQQLLPGFSTCENNFHYHWQYNRGSKRIHFFMLNNALGFDEIGNDPFYSPTDSAARDERNPYGALNFLQKYLDAFSDDDMYVIFCHINFCSMEIESKITDGYNGKISIYDHDRWWNEGSMKQFIALINQSQGKYLCSFFGHLHTSAGMEILKMDEKHKYLGYRCACGGKHGAAHYLLAEIDLASKEPEVKVTPYSNTGVKEDDIDKDVRTVDMTMEKWK